MLRQICFCILVVFPCVAQTIETPCYRGGLYGQFAWFYPQPRVSDGDLQYGTALTLTGPPLEVDQTQNLSARVLQIEPEYTSAYRASLGYAFPCSNTHLELGYFHLGACDSDSVTSPVRNADIYQFLQNFLGGGYVSGEARDKQKIDQAQLCLGKHYILDGCFHAHPYIGLGYINVRRDLDADFSDFAVPPVVNPVPATLVGSLESRYWGVGATLGADLTFPLSSCFDFTAMLGISGYWGEVCSEIDSSSERPMLSQSFSAKESSYRITPGVRSQLALSFHRPINCWCALDFTVGYETDYFFRVVDRVNPEDGYVNNPGSVPKVTTSSIGLGGPFVQLAIAKPMAHFSAKPLLCGTIATGLYCTIENGWVQACPNNKDLTYALVRFSDGSSKDQEIDPDFDWSGEFHLGYFFPCNFALDAGYRIYTNKAANAVSSQSISSLNASGPAGVLFTEASSSVDYTLHQFDLSLQKSVRPCCPLEFNAFLGFRFLQLRRCLDNAYLGGTPPDLTESKFPELRSHSWGIGPLLGVKPTLSLCGPLGITGLFDVALPVGKTSAKLNQINFGTVLGETSNTLRTHNIQSIVPIIDTKIALFTAFRFCNICVDAEIGYLFSDYFKAIDLVFPNFLTGLNQNASSLYLRGPYLSLNIYGF